MKISTPRIVCSVFIASAALLASCQTSGTASSTEWKPDPGFTSLFDGKDLTGWQYKAANGVTPGLFTGMTASNDGRFTANDGVLVVNALPAGAPRAIRTLWTVQNFPGDFVLKIEFRAAPRADSGIFLRGRQLQCRDYTTVGPAPYMNLKNYKPQDWNLIEVTVKNNVAVCTCNGEVLEAAYTIPANGNIGLEADGGQMEYRHIQIKPL